MHFPIWQTLWPSLPLYNLPLFSRIATACRADRRQLGAADGAREQQDTEPILKLADPLAQGRLRDVKRGRRTPEA
jgi:hypothetical protein